MCVCIKLIWELSIYGWYWKLWDLKTYSDKVYIKKENRAKNGALQDLGEYVEPEMATRKEWQVKVGENKENLLSEMPNEVFQGREYAEWCGKVKKMVTKSDFWTCQCNYMYTYICIYETDNSDKSSFREVIKIYLKK